MAAQTEQVPNILRQGRVTPWLYLLPALIVMTTFIVYPGLNTLFLSFRNTGGTEWAGADCLAGEPGWGAACRGGEPCWGVFENYRYALTSDIMESAFVNNLKWIGLIVSGTVLL